MKENNISILILNTNYETKNGHITLEIIEEFKKVFPTKSVVLAEYNNAIELAKKNKFDIFLAIDGQKIDECICSRLADLCKVSFLWVFEDPYTLNHNVKVSNIFDCVLTNDAECVSFYKNASYLPLASSKSFKELEVREESEYKYDVMFCGSAWPNRVKIINELIKQRPLLKYKLILQESKYLPKVELPIPRSEYVGSINFENFRDICNRSRIVISLHRSFNADNNKNHSSSPGPRIFEVAEAGGFQLVDVDDVPVDKFFSSSEVATFCGLDELVEKIDYFLSNSKKRINMARKAKLKCEESELYRNRARKIIEIFESQPKKEIKRRSAPKRKLLYVTHNSIKSEHFGGLEIHQDVLAKNISAEFNVYFFHVDRTPNSRWGKHKKSKYLLTDSNYNTIEEFLVDQIDTKATLFNPQYEKMFSSVLVRYQIDLIHFFHLIGHIPSYGRIAKSLGIPYLCSIHDFYNACESFNLLDYRGKYCIGNSSKITQCDICLSKKKGVNSGSQSIRRAIYGELLESADSIVTVSESATDILCGFYPQLKRHKSLISHGAPLPSKYSTLLSSTNKNTTNLKNGGLKVLIMGNLAPNKGGEDVVDIISYLKKEDFVFEIYGSIDSSIKKRLDELSLANVILHGRYSPGEVPISKFDVSLHLSIWPETYCQTLSESWLNKVVPIVTDIGALGGRVSDGINGFKVEVGAIWDIIDILHYLRDNPNELIRIRNNIDSNLYLSQTKHAKVFRDEYLKIDKVRAPDFKSGLSIDLNSNKLGYSLKDSRWIRINNVINKPKGEKFIKNIKVFRKKDYEINLSAKAHIDTINSQNVSPLRKRDSFYSISISDEIKVVGWYFITENNIGVSDTYLLFSKKNSDYYTAVKLNRSSRMDLASKFGVSNSLNCRIDADFVVDKDFFDTGDYNLFVGQISSKVLYVAETDLSIKVERSKEAFIKEKVSNKGSVLRKKLNKLTNNPEQFVKDSKNPIVQTLGSFLVKG